MTPGGLSIVPGVTLSPASKDPGVESAFERRELLAQAEGLVEAIAGKLKRSSLGLERADLIAYGQKGLMEALQRFDPARGDDFRRFAYYRVKGAMLDGVRQQGSWSRRAYERVRMLEDVVEMGGSLNASSQSGAASPAQAEERLRKHMAQMVTAAALGTLRAPPDESGREPKDPTPNAEQILLQQELRARVRLALSELPEPDGSIVSRHYLGGERLDQVASDLGLSKSWVSRIHARAVQRLAQRLRSA